MTEMQGSEDLWVRSGQVRSGLALLVSSAAWAEHLLAPSSGRLSCPPNRQHAHLPPRTLPLPSSTMSSSVLRSFRAAAPAARAASRTQVVSRRAASSKAPVDHSQPYKFRNDMPWVSIAPPRHDWQSPA
jgi:hypothetical protein